MLPFRQYFQIFWDYLQNSSTNQSTAIWKRQTSATVYGGKSFADKDLKVIMPNLVFAIPLFRGDVEKTPDIFEVFYTCAVNDSFEREYSFQDNPRQVALETITEQYFSHPQTLPLLRDRDANDPDEQVREFAKKKLAELG